MQPILRRRGYGVGNRTRRLYGLDEGGRAIEDQKGVDAGVGEQRIQRGGVALAGSIADDVDGIAVAPGRRQDLAQPLDRLRRQRGQPAARRFERIGRKHAGAAAIRQDRQPVAVLRVRERQRLGGIEQLGHRRDAQHPRATKRGVIDRVAAGEHPGMRGRRPCTGRGTPGLEYEHRLAARGGARRRHEFAAVGDALDVEQDGACVRVDGEIVEHVAEIDVRHVAQRDDMRKADAARRRPVEHRRDHGARLGDKGDVARRRGEMREAGIEPDARHHDADAVGTDEAQEVRARRLEHCLLQGAPGFTQLAEAGGNDDRGLRAARPQARQRDRGPYRAV